MTVRPPIITLTTDFGWRDHYVGAMKGVILEICPDVTIVDVSHDVPPQDVAHGAFVIGEAHRTFPPSAIHLCVVDPGVGTERRAVILITPYGRFVAPDNGLLTHALARANPDRDADESGWAAVPAACSAYVVAEPRFWRHPVSATFHGRDVFAPIAARLAGGLEPAEVGPSTDRLAALDRPEPRVGKGIIEGQVVHVDAYGNLVTNIDGELITGANASVLVAKVYVGSPVHTFADGDGLIALVGSLGYLEIAVSGGSAAECLKIGVGEPVRVLVDSGGLDGPDSPINV